MALFLSIDYLKEQHENIQNILFSATVSPYIFLFELKVT